MKLKYTKPAMVMEHFALSQTIAYGGCGAVHTGNLGEPTHYTKETCGWDVGGISVWVSNPTCDIPASPDADGYGVCYNNPDGSNTIFSSW